MHLIVIIHNQSSTYPFNKVVELCKAISINNINITLISTSPNRKTFINSIELDNIQIVEMPDLLWGKYRQGIDPFNVLMRIIYMLHKKYDAILAIDCRPVVIIPALVIKKINKIPLLLCWWDLYGSNGTSLERSGKVYYKTIGKVEAFFEEYFRKYADYSIVVSSFLKEKLVSLNYPPSRIELQRIGCNYHDITSYNKFVIRKEYHLSTNDILLCFAGNIFENDKKLLVSSLRILKNKIKTLPQTIIIGEQFIEDDICKELSISIMGKIESSHEFKKILFSCDYALVPMNLSVANRARWPSKTTDYWSVGLPVISTPISDYTELFEKYNLGYLSFSDSPNDYAEAIFTAINTSEDIYKGKQKSIKYFLENELSWDVITKKYINIFKKIL